MKNPTKIADKILFVSKNKKYHLEYNSLYKIECGLVLYGDEVKSLRKHSPSILNSYCYIHKSELWIKNLPLVNTNNMDREKKLLAHRNQINKINGLCTNPRVIIVPIELYNKNGLFKIVIICGERLKKVDKREKIKEKEMTKNMKHIF